MANKVFNKVWAEHIPSSVVNDAIDHWFKDRGDRVQTCASPSTLLECPRVIWLKRRGVAPTDTPGWGRRQRWGLGRIVESVIAKQLREDGKLIWWWEDEFAGQSQKFTHGEGLDYIEGTPDLLVRLREGIAISDSKTSRSDAYGFVPVTPEEIWADSTYYKYKLQLTAYYLLCHWNKDWFEHRNLPLPELCHLFSYSLDDGIVRRDLIWKPTKADALKVKHLIRRWNAAYAAEEMPECTCIEEDHVKFCPYGVRGKDEKGKPTKVCVTCCDDKLKEEV